MVVALFVYVIPHTSPDYFETWEQAIPKFHLLQTISLYTFLQFHKNQLNLAIAQNTSKES